MPFVVWIMPRIGMKGRRQDRLASSTMCTYHRVMAQRATSAHSSKALLLSFSRQESMRRRLLKNGRGWSRESTIHCCVRTRTRSLLRTEAAFVPCPCKELFSVHLPNGHVANSVIREQWNRMKHLYIEKQQSMLLRKTALTEGGPDRSGGQTKLSDVVVTPAAIAPALHFPVGCLVFVKNLSPGTNKAVLRSLLASAFSADSSGYIDYVDYTRGLASVSLHLGHFQSLTDSESHQCHVRLSSPDHAKLLVDYFTANRVVQVDGQDATGREGEAQGWIVAQVVTGRLEEMYWDKVPERIRVDVMRRIQQQDAPPAEQGTHDGPSDNKRKRRKKLS